MRGITFLKMDFGHRAAPDVPGALSVPTARPCRSVAMTMHPFTGIEITDKGIALLAEYVGSVRAIIGMEIPLASDHFGHIGVNSCIKLGPRAGEVEPGLAGGHGAVAVRAADEADHHCETTCPS